jgi:hypothetical protein
MHGQRFEHSNLNVFQERVAQLTLNSQLEYYRPKQSYQIPGGHSLQSVIGKNQKTTSHDT